MNIRRHNVGVKNSKFIPKSIQTKEESKRSSADPNGKQPKRRNTTNTITQDLFEPNQNNEGKSHSLFKKKRIIFTSESQIRNSNTSQDTSLSIENNT